MLDLLLGEYCILNQGRKRPSVIVLQIQILNPFSTRFVGELKKQLYNLIIRKCESKKKKKNKHLRLEDRLRANGWGQNHFKEIHI